MALPLAPEASFLTPFPRPRWADYVEQGNWAENGIVDREAAARVTERDLVNYVVACRDESLDHRSPLHVYWDWYDALYNLEAYDDEKQAWQTQIAIPEIRTKVRVAKSILKASLVDAPEFFKLFAYKLWDEPHVRMIQRWLQHVQQQAGLVDAYADALEEGLLYGSGCMGLSVEDYVSHRPQMKDPDPAAIQQWMQQAQWAIQNGQQPPPQPMPYMAATAEPRNKFLWKHKAIRDCFPDPFSEGGDVNKGRYFVEYSETDEDVLWERAAIGMYDGVEDIGEPVRSTLNRDLRSTTNDRTRIARKRHGIIEFQGDVIIDGKLVAKDWMATVVNERAVVRCAPNPLVTKKRRYIWVVPLKYRGRVWGSPLIDADAHVQVLVTRLLELVVDSSSFAGLNVFNWDSSKSDEPQPPDTISPGMIIPGNNGPALTKIDFSNRANEMWPIIQQLMDWGAKSTQISEFVDGQPNAKGRPSAAEVSSKTAAGQQHLNNIMRSQEVQVLEPALQLTMDYVVQFGGDQSDPRLSEILQEWGGPQALMDERFRLGLLTKDYKLKVHGISTMLGRESLISRLMQAQQLAMQLGVPLQSQFEIYYMILGVLGFDPEQLKLPPGPDELRQMLMMQQAAMMGGAGPGIGGPIQGGAPMMPSQAGSAPPTPQAVMNQAQAGGPPMPG